MERDMKDAQIEEFEAGKKILLVGYGNSMQIIGHIEVLDSTSYADAKKLIKPFVKEYLSFSNADIIPHLVENFRLLDNNNKEVVGKDLLVSCTV